METATKKQRGTLSGQVRHFILTKILSGEFEPGERLIEMKIARQMQTSQAPVREAIRELESTGLLETLPNRGSRIRKISNQELSDIYDVRAQLEGYAAEVICQKQIRITEQLEDAVDRMLRAAKRENMMLFASINHEFHSIIIQHAENEILLKTWQTLHIQIKTFLIVNRLDKNLIEMAESHFKIIDAFKIFDAVKARSEVISHIYQNRPEKVDQ